MSEQIFIKASYAPEDEYLGIMFRQVKSGDTFYTQIEDLRPELQQKFPQLVRGLVVHALPERQCPADAHPTRAGRRGIN